MEKLHTLLQQIEGRGYKAYKQLLGVYNFKTFQLTIDHVQGDPFALPSRISIQLTAEQHGILPEFWVNRIRQTGLEDFLAREIYRAIRATVSGRRGSGKSGVITANLKVFAKIISVIVDFKYLQINNGKMLFNFAIK